MTTRLSRLVSRWPASWPRCWRWPRPRMPRSASRWWSATTITERAQAAEGRQRRPHHGRYAQAARLHRDGGGKSEPAGISQTLLAFDRAVDPAIPHSFSMPATALRSQARIFCCRPMCRPRAKARKNWCAMLRCSPTASSSGCRTRRCGLPFWCSMPAATIRSSVRGTRAVAGGGGLAPMTQLPEGVFSVFSAGPRQTALDRLSNEDGNPNSVFTRTFAKELTAARREPGPGRAAHAPLGQRDGGDRPPQADPGLFRPDGRRRVSQWRIEGAG